jgi:hypothetical protein
MTTRAHQPKTPAAVDTIPAGAKSVTRTTREEFVEQLEEKTVANELAELETLDDEDLDNDDDFEEAEPLSPVHKFLDSLKERIGEGSGSIRIYAIRKPDPVGIVFKTPCNTEYTAGDVPYDEADLSVEALEVSIQKLYGGGRYQIKVRQNGDYAGAITRNIRDLPETTNTNGQRAAQSQTEPAPSPPASQTDELVKTLNLAKTIHEIFVVPGRQDNARQQQREELPAAKPLDPFETATASLNMLEKAKDLFDRGDPAPSGGSSERHWIDSAANLIEKLHIGSAIEKLVEFGLSVAVEKNKAEILAAGTNGRQPRAANPPSGSEVQPPPRELNNAATSPRPAEAQAEPPAGAITPEQLAILEEVVTEMRAYNQEDEDDEHLEERAKRAAASLRKLPLELQAQLLPLPTMFLGAALSQLKPDWADIANFQDGSGFIDAVKDELANPEEGSGERVQFPAAVDSSTTKAPPPETAEETTT